MWLANLNRRFMAPPNPVLRHELAPEGIVVAVPGSTMRTTGGITVNQVTGKLATAGTTMLRTTTPYGIGFQATEADDDYTEHKFSGLATNYPHTIRFIGKWTRLFISNQGALQMNGSANSTNHNCQWHFDDATNGFHVTHDQTTGTTRRIRPTNDLRTTLNGKFTEYVATHDGTDTTHVLYLDGQAIASTVMTTSSYGSQKVGGIWFGRAGTTFGITFLYLLCEVYDRALRPREIADLARDPWKAYRPPPAKIWFLGARNAPAGGGPSTLPKGSLALGGVGI